MSRGQGAMLPNHKCMVDGHHNLCLLAINTLPLRVHQMQDFQLQKHQKMFGSWPPVSEWAVFNVPSNTV